MSPSASPVRWSTGRALLSAAAILAFSLGIAAAKKTGLMAPELARQVAGVGFSLLIILAGNRLPKLVPALQADPSQHARLQRADRRAGLLLVVIGLLCAGAWLVLPGVVARTVAGGVGVVGFVLAAATLWSGGARLERLPPLRAGLLQILAGLAGAHLIFVADGVFGDTAALVAMVGWMVVQGLASVGLGCVPGARSAPHSS